MVLLLRWEVDSAFAADVLYWIRAYRGALPLPPMHGGVVSHRCTRVIARGMWRDLLGELPTLA